MIEMAEKAGLDMSESARMARAKDMGWDVENKIYHGTDKDFDQFKTEKIGSGSGAQTEGWGIYFSGSKKNADRFGGNVKEIVMPEYFNGRFLNYDLKFSDQPDYIKKIFPEYRYLPDGHPRAGQERTGQEIYSQIVKESNGSSQGTSKYLGRLGIVGAKFRAGKDLHARDKDANNFVIWDQDALNDLRQSNAAFDPEKIDSPNLFAGAATIGGIGGGAALMATPQNSYADSLHDVVMKAKPTTREIMDSQRKREYYLNQIEMLNRDDNSIQTPQSNAALSVASGMDKYNKERKKRLNPVLDFILPAGELPVDYMTKLGYGDEIAFKDRLNAVLGML